MKKICILLLLFLLTACTNHNHSFDIYKEDEIARWMECECGEKNEYHEFTEDDIYTDIIEYQANLTGDYQNNYAYYYGEGIHDIKIYIPNFSERYADLVEMQFGQVLYVGNDPDVISKMTSNFIRIGQSFVYADYVRNVDAYLDMARNFYFQKEQIQYDQNITNDRKLYEVAPEDATDDKYMYMDCSSFVNTSFYNTFGEPILKGYQMSEIKTVAMINYAKNNQEDEEVIYYYEVTGDESNADKNKVISELKQILMPGDVYIYRHGEVDYSGGAGHAMLYMGTDEFLHSTGSSYNYGSNQEKFETGGTIRKDSAIDTVFNLTNRRNPFYKSTDGTDDNTRIAVIRPLNRKGLKLTNDTVSRNVAPGLRFEKSATPNNYLSVSYNEKIEYTITVTNDSAYPINNVSILDEFSSSLEYVNGSVNYDGVNKDCQILWNILEIKPKETIVVSYSVEVKENKIGHNLSCFGYVGHIRTNLIENTIRGISLAEEKQFQELALTYLNSNIQYSNSLELIVEIYQKYSELINKNYNVFDYLSDLSINNVLNEIFNVENKTLKEDTKLSYLLVPGNYGGLNYISYQNYDCHKLLLNKYLMPGDIIVASRYTNDFEAYLYLGKCGGYSDLIIYVSNSSVKMIQYTNSTKLLESLNGYNYYGVIRPFLNK